MVRLVALLAVGMQMSAEPTSDATVVDSVAILEWRAPRACPQPSDVEARLAEYLGDRAPAIARDGGVRAVGIVDERDESGEYRLELRILANGAVDARTIDGPRCDELAQAFALVVAVTLEPLAVVTTVRDRTRSEVPEPPGPTEPPDEREPLEAGAVAPSGPVAAVDRDRVSLAVVPFGHAWAAYGPMRAPTAAVGGGMGLSLNRVSRIELGALHRFGSVVGADVTTRITTTTATATGCGVPRTKTVEFPLCLGLELGSIEASDTQGLAETRVVRSLWSAVVLGARVMWPLRPWLALGAHASGSVSYTPVIFGIDDDDRKVFRSAPVGARVGLAIEARIPVTNSRGSGQ